MKKISILFWFVFVAHISNVFSADETQPLLVQYEALMKEFPPSDQPLKTCVAPDLKSNRQSRRYRTALSYEFKEKSIAPNFCGKYYLTNEPITGGGMIFLVDCATGKIKDLKEEYASNAPNVNVNSCLLIEHAPGKDELAKTYRPSAFGPPRLYLWNGKALVKKHDPVLSQ